MSFFPICILDVVNFHSRKNFFSSFSFGFDLPFSHSHVCVIFQCYRLWSLLGKLIISWGRWIILTRLVLCHPCFCFVTINTAYCKCSFFRCISSIIAWFTFFLFNISKDEKKDSHAVGKWERIFKWRRIDFLPIFYGEKGFKGNMFLLSGYFSFYMTS